MYEIKTSNYVKPLNVNIDGKAWTMKIPGSGTEMRLGQIQRRIKLLANKIESDQATEQELDKYDGLETQAYQILESIFQDGTDDNSEVKQWMKDLPMQVIVEIMDDIKAQKKAKDGEPTEQESTNS